jgi:hypothetical protein
MRARTGSILFICCCAGLAACTAAAPKGPNTTVTTPSVGRPPSPVSAQAALSSEALTSYFGLGAAPDDGLAPGETYAALHTACMQDAGYGQYANISPYAVRANRGMAFAQAYGPWGYIGVADAEQYGFTVPTESDSIGSPGPPPTSLPAAAQAAAGKCANIVLDFNDAQFATSLAGIETMNNVISDDVVNDPEFKNAMKAWSACMARNGSSSDADTLANQELTVVGLRPAAGSAPGQTPGSGPTAAQNKAQIATAVTDADCTLAADLAGIYLRHPGQLRAAGRRRQPAGAQRRSPRLQGRLRQGAEQAPRAAADRVGHPELRLRLPSGTPQPRRACPLGARPSAPAAQPQQHRWSTDALQTASMEHRCCLRF